jgi:nucleolar protein 58
MGTRDKAAGVDFSGVLEQDVEDALKAAAQISMGTEISQEDLDNILALCDQVRCKGVVVCKTKVLNAGLHVFA